MLEEDTLEFDAFLKKNDEMVIAPTLIFWLILTHL